MLRTACDCSLIIPTRNRRDVLARTLARLTVLPDACFEILVIDNGSTDGTTGLQLDFPETRWIELGENRAAAARNIAAEQARGRVLFMLDDDSWPDPGVIDAIVREMDDRPHLGAIACRVLLANSGGRHDAGGVPGIFFNCGGAVRRDAFLKVGGYPREYDYYVEEYDLCCRLWQSGLRVEAHGHLVVHHERTIENRDNNRMLRFLVRNNIALWRRYAPPELREDLIVSTIERYARVARNENALPGFEAGMNEAHNLPIELNNFTPLTLDQFGELYGLKTARRVLRDWADKRAIRRIAIWSRGKGCEQVVDIAISLGFEIDAVYDSPASIDERPTWRGRALKPESAFNPAAVQGIVAGTLSPGVAEDTAYALASRFPGLPVVSLAPWLFSRSDCVAPAIA